MMINPQMRKHVTLVKEGITITTTNRVLAQELLGTGGFHTTRKQHNYVFRNPLKTQPKRK